MGIDLGLASLVTLDDGTKVDHPRLLKKYEKELSRLQRGLHRKEKGSKNRGKARERIARLYTLISDTRRDMLDQLTTRLVRENQVLVVEDLAMSVREWTCAECGATHDRDVNAARNLREEGLRLYWLVASALPPARMPPSVIKASELEDVLLAA